MLGTCSFQAARSVAIARDQSSFLGATKSQMTGTPAPCSFYPWTPTSFLPCAVFPPDPEKKLDTLTPRLVYCLVNALGLAYACYRIYGMGLFPTHLTDWASTIPAPRVPEVAVSTLW